MIEPPTRITIDIGDDGRVSAMRIDSRIVQPQAGTMILRTLVSRAIAAEIEAARAARDIGSPHWRGPR